MRCTSFRHGIVWLITTLHLIGVHLELIHTSTTRINYYTINIMFINMHNISL